MEKITAVFFDVDGTILNSKHEMLESTRIVLKRLEELDIPYAIASARGPGAIFPLFKNFDFHSAMVSYNGALIYDKDAKLLQSLGLSLLEAKEIVHFIEELEPEVLINVYSYQDWIVKDAEHPRVKLEETIVGEYARTAKIKDLQSDKVHKIFCIGEPDSILNLEQALKEKFSHLYIARSSNQDVQVNMTGVNKAQGVKILADFWGIDLKDSIAFGDSYNDIEMLQTVGRGFVMGNGDEKLKELLGNYTDDNDSDGIYLAMQSLGLFD